MEDILSYIESKLSCPSLCKYCSDGFLLSFFNKARNTFNPFESFNKKDKYVNCIKLFFLNFFKALRYRTDIIYNTFCIKYIYNII